MKPFSRSDVRLADSPIRQRQIRNGEYLLALPVDRLVHNFRVNAGLASSAAPLGGWESPQCGLRGHFTGHYLSAVAQMFASTGDEQFKTRTDALVQALQTCQDALGDGYLSAFPLDQFDTLEEKFGGAWAPYYTLHKILMGLIDAHRDAQNATALVMATQLGDWVARRIGRLPESIREPLLKTTSFNPANEYGGIGDAMYELFSLSNDRRHLEAAQIFDRDWFAQPLVQQQDILAGLHANTHIPQALAIARRYEIGGEEQYRRAAEYFWQRTAIARSYANGGSSGPRPDRAERSEGGEHWPDAFKLGGTLTPKINESCVAHNMLRLTDRLYAWSADATLAEFRERVFFNSILAMQHPHQIGAYIYGHPLAHGSRKIFGDFDATFWCCYGTSVEAFSRLADGIYYDDGDTLSIAQYIASSAQWKARQVDIRLETAFPEDPNVRIVISTRRETPFTLRLRLPLWAQHPTWRLNDSSAQSAAGQWLEIQRTWRDGDQVQLQLPMSLRFEPMPGDDHMIAFFHGPTLLAARTAHALELGVSKDAALANIRETPSGWVVKLGFGDEVPLVPINQIGEETFGAYFMTAGK